jgi:transposase InsO family protein
MHLRHIFKSGGFQLVKLKSNKNEILDKARNNLTDIEKLNGKIFSEETEEKLLGYLLNFEEDHIKVALTLDKIPASILNCEEKPTKKQVLQLCMSIFDPMGFMEFLLSKFKLLYHLLVKDNYEWAQVMSDDYFAMWKKCIGHLSKVTDIKIPRLYSQKLLDAKFIQLVGFGDAGTEMLCAVIYIRLLDEERKQIDYRFVCSKSYTVPRKQSRSIPDLEVDIACKLALLMNKIQAQHRIKFNERMFFTDNIAVRDWIVNGAKNPKVYQANRLAKIANCTKKEEWRWVSTNHMPADFGTKMSSMPEVKYQNDWFQPILFQMPEENWPTIEANNSINLNIVNDAQESNLDLDFINISKFSSFNGLMTGIMRAAQLRYRLRIRIINKKLAKCKKEVARTRAAQNRKKAKINALKQKKVNVFEAINDIYNHYGSYEQLLIQVAQKESFPKEIAAIQSQKELKVQSPLYKLLPYVDDKGTLRAQTRIPRNDENVRRFTLDKINPIILPREHHLTKLIILKYHDSMAHHNEKTVVVNLIQRFFIPKIKRTVNTVIKKHCLTCKISKAKPKAPRMGDVPSHRLAYFIPAFSYAIVDLLGPILVKVTRNVRAKRYILVYSCLTTRALHLELIERLDADATLRALQNTFNLRGVPIRICSDNGTNFVAASRIIKEHHALWNAELLRKGAIIHPIQWFFSPAKAPHFNGSVERVVGLVKVALRNIKEYLDMKYFIYDDYGLKAVLCEIINMINSRPVAILSEHNNDHLILTPNFFIMGRQNAQSVPPEAVVPNTLTQQWHDIKMISNMLWEKWLKEYLPVLTSREKWIDKAAPLEIGDIVITADPSIANSWRLGIIENVIHGSQDQVRQVVIRLGKNKVVDKAMLKNPKQLRKFYKDETSTVISRPSISVAKLDLSRTHEA